MIGYTGLSLMIPKYCFKWLSPCISYKYLLGYKFQGQIYSGVKPAHASPFWSTSVFVISVLFLIYFNFGSTSPTHPSTPSPKFLDAPLSFSYLFVTYKQQSSIIFTLFTCRIHQNTSVKTFRKLSPSHRSSDQVYLQHRGPSAQLLCTL